MNLIDDIPTKLVFGIGSFRHAGTLIAELGGRALLVTGRSAMNSAGYSGQLIDDLNRRDVAVSRFSEFHDGPTTDDIDRGVGIARRSNVDVVVALGGGSALDCGKAIAGVMSVEASAADVLHGQAVITKAVPPIVCIPSTAGTGSELNRSAIITDSTLPFRDGLRSDLLFPQYAIVDSSLTRTVPPAVMAQTGFDVLAHAVESYLSPKATPRCNDLALRAIDAICGCLPALIQNPCHRHSDDVRDRISFASTSMGINLSCVGTCFPHRGDKAIGALRPEIPHGQRVALLYPYWLHSIEQAAAAQLATLATHVDPTSGSMNLPQAARHAVNSIQQLIRDIGLATRWKDFSIHQGNIPELAACVAGDLSVNPVPLTRDDLPTLFRQILDGEFE